MTDMTHLAGRSARPADAPDDGTVLDRWSGRRVPEHHPRLLAAHAHEYARLVAQGGTEGAAHAYLNRLSQEGAAWFSALAFAEAVAARLARTGG